MPMHMNTDVGVAIGAVLVATLAVLAVLTLQRRQRQPAAKPVSKLLPLREWTTCALGPRNLGPAEQVCALRHLQTLAVPVADADYDEAHGDEGYVSADWIRLKDHTHCVFAKTSKVMGGTRWDPALSLEANVVQSIPLLLRFNQRIANGQMYDGFVIEIEDERYGDTIEHFGGTVTRVLETLSVYDPVHDHAMFGPIHLNIWNFTFGGLQNAFFISSFAPCYGTDHSRYAYGSKSTFVLLQPELSFVQKSIAVDSDPQSVRHLIRKRFEEAGQPYDPRDRKVYTMLNWIVRPLDHSDEALPWWTFGKGNEATK